ncbi:MAG: hypothetical protein CK426_06095 [Legionella sp.]|nr:MAG: hypothetical protein CK423_02315 [Legionella sp.]PJD98465.1 MAG: hypothetical protein CK426_06095 [Legionella sp.]
MTFNLKDYNELKNNYSQTISIMLERDNKKSINELSSPRKEQLLFLQDVIKELDERLRTPATTGKTKHRGNNAEGQRILAILRYDMAQVLYGAMSLMVTLITNDLTIMHTGSLLRSRLLVDMGITATQKPSELQYKNCYRYLNHFLSLLFNENDSSNGINRNHSLQNCDVKFLVKLMRESHEQERNYFKSDLDLFTDNGEAWNDSMGAHFNRGNPSIPFEWNALKRELGQLKTEELARKNVAEFTLLNPVRACQLQFLEQIMETLNSLSELRMPSSMKAAILAGAMHIVRGQISQEYGNGLLNFTDTSSLVHNRLNSLLNHAVKPEQIELLVNAAQHFILFLTTEAQQIRGEHPLSKIDGFSLINTLKLSQDILYETRIEGLNIAYKRYKKENKEMNSSHKEHSGTAGLSSLFGGMFYRSSASSSSAAASSTLKKEAATEADSPSLR